MCLQAVDDVVVDRQLAGDDQLQVLLDLQQARLEGVQAPRHAFHLRGQRADGGVLHVTQQVLHACRTLFVLSVAEQYEAYLLGAYGLNRNPQPGPKRMGSTPLLRC